MIIIYRKKSKLSSNVSATNSPIVLKLKKLFLQKTVFCVIRLYHNLRRNRYLLNNVILSKPNVPD